MGDVTVKKSWRDGHVGVRFSVTAHDRGNNIKVSGGCDLSTEAARELARLLVEESDRADAEFAKKEASDARRKKWRDREIAAGRMKVLDWR